METKEASRSNATSQKVTENESSTKKEVCYDHRLQAQRTGKVGCSFTGVKLRGENCFRRLYLKEKKVVDEKKEMNIQGKQKPVLSLQHAPLIRKPGGRLKQLNIWMSIIFCAGCRFTATDDENFVLFYWEKRGLTKKKATLDRL